MGLSWCREHGLSLRSPDLVRILARMVIGKVPEIINNGRIN
jgi:hypothetical protein